jgi:hypothetical protein
MISSGDTPAATSPSLNASSDSTLASSDPVSAPDVPSVYIARPFVWWPVSIRLPYRTLLFIEEGFETQGGKKPRVPKRKLGAFSEISSLLASHNSTSFPSRKPEIEI